MNEILQRLSTIIDKHYDGSRPDFARSLGKRPDSLHGYFQKDSKPGSDLLAEILTLGFSADWLLSGEGAMYADNEAGRALANRNASDVKQRVDGRSQEDIRIRAQRWQMAREWFTKTGTITEWYWLARSVDEAVTLEWLLFQEGGKQPHEPPTLNKFWLWIAESGIRPEWMLFCDEGEPWMETVAGRRFQERLRQRFTPQREIVPVNEALPEYSA